MERMVRVDPPGCKYNTGYDRLNEAGINSGSSSGARWVVSLQGQIFQISHHNPHYKSLGRIDFQTAGSIINIWNQLSGYRMLNYFQWDSISIPSTLHFETTSVLTLRRLDLTYYMPDCDSSVFNIDAAFLGFLSTVTYFELLVDYSTSSSWISELLSSASWWVFPIGH